MDLIKNKIDKYLLMLIEKENITPEEYAILAYEYDKRKKESKKASDDTILRIFKTID